MNHETTAQAQSLHDQIMRLPCIPPKDANVNQMLSYKYGHRAARHAAAELARSLARLAKVADDAVLSEPEFAAPPAPRSQWVPELFCIDRVPDDFRNQASGYRAGWNDCRAAMLAAPSDTAAPAPQRKFSGPGHLEETGYIPAGSTAEREKATRDMWGTLECRLPEKHRSFNGPALRSALGILYDAGYHKIEGEPIPPAPEQAGPRLAISSQEQLAALLNGVQALHEISAELIAECVFEQIVAEAHALLGGEA